MSDDYTPSMGDVRRQLDDTAAITGDSLDGAVFARALAEHDRQVAEKAWAKGHHDALVNVSRPLQDRTNPYAPSTALEGVQEESKA